MITTLESTTSQYEQQLTTALGTAINGNDLISALSAHDASQLNSRLKYIFTNYTKSHATSSAHGLMIQQALDAEFKFQVQHPELKK